MEHTTALRRLDDSTIPYAERARRRCQLAKDLESAGNYEAARGAMSGLWARVGERPRLDGLDETTIAEVLLRAGCLTGWIGRAQQLEGAQELAKGLINESLRLFEQLALPDKIAEAHTDLAYCDWRRGAFDEARIGMRTALTYLADSSTDQKAITLIRSATVEISAKDYREALRLLDSMSPLMAASHDHALKGKFYMNLGIVLKELSVSEQNVQYRDRALIEHEAAIFHLGKAGHTQYRANTENNLGFLMLTAGKFQDAHNHLTTAYRLFLSLKDKASAAQVQETQARLCLANNRNAEAERLARAAASIHEQGDELALLAEALTTQGKALARLHKHLDAKVALSRAADVADQAGDSEGAVDAYLTLIEELGQVLSDEELSKTWESIDFRLTDTPQYDTLQRLRAASRRMLLSRRTTATAIDSKDFIHASSISTELLRRAHVVAPQDCTVLLTGESGTGKEVLANLIHKWSGRLGPFVAINCAAIPDNLMESELFGHRKGAFTDAHADYTGAAKHATGGTLFLDEIGELTLSGQAKILRLIENKEIHTLGATSPEAVNVRIIAATNRSLRKAAAEGTFRQDLLYRLDVFTLNLPPLRERPEDIEALARHFINAATRRYKKKVPFAPEAVTELRQLPLKGNARELRALIESAILMIPAGGTITAEAVKSFAIRSKDNLGLTLADPWASCSFDDEVLRYEEQLIRLAIEKGKTVTGAARLLGMSHQRLSLMLKERHKGIRAEKPRQVFGTPPRLLAARSNSRKS